MKPLRLKNMIAGCLLAAGALPVWGQSGAPTLVIRIDDLGALHSVNEACIQTYRSGIARSVEVMPVAAWYPEAIKMLKENRGRCPSCRRRPAPRHHQRVGEREVASADPLPQLDGRERLFLPDDVP